MALDQTPEEVVKLSPDGFKYLTKSEPVTGVCAEHELGHAIGLEHNDS